MDTKLKSNKKYINSRLLVLSIIITISSVMLGISHFNSIRYYSYDDSINRDISYVYNALRDLTLYAENLKGELKENSIISQVEEQKRFYKESAEKCELDIEERENQIRYEYENNDYYDRTLDLGHYINEDSIIQNYKTQLDEAKKNISRSDDEIRREVERNFKIQVDSDLEKINNNSAIEYYFETDNPDKPLTNVKVDSAESFIEETNEKYEYYAMAWFEDGEYLKTSTSKGQRGILDYGIDEYDGRAGLIRVKEPLDPAGSMNSLISSKKLVGSSFIIGDISLAICILVSIFLVISIYKNRKIDIKEKYNNQIIW